MLCSILHLDLLRWIIRRNLDSVQLTGETKCVHPWNSSLHSSVPSQITLCFHIDPPVSWRFQWYSYHSPVLWNTLGVFGWKVFDIIYQWWFVTAGYSQQNLQCRAKLTYSISHRGNKCRSNPGTGSFVRLIREPVRGSMTRPPDLRQWHNGHRRWCMGADSHTVA